jgi:monovalent cation/hydrogen antiporter
VRKDYEAHLDVIQARAEDDDDHPALQRHDTAVALELALVQHKAATLLRLRDADEIDDLVLRQVRAGYDAEEARLSGAAPA